MASPYVVSNPKEWTRNESPLLADLFPLAISVSSVERIGLYRFTSAKDTRDGVLLSPSFPKLVDVLHDIFNKEIEDGVSYPQEYPLTVESFEAYFLAFDGFVAILGCPSFEEMGEIEKGEDAATSWRQRVVGMMYIKPNFPGRCSHICNGGFVVTEPWRRKGIGKAMAKEFVRVAPLLGYKAAMFNLVFVNNEASIRMWEGLGFKMIGLLPAAGRLKNSNEILERYAMKRKQGFSCEH